MTFFKKLAAAVVATLAAGTLVVAAPQQALAAGTVRDDDGGSETTLYLDHLGDYAVKRLVLPGGILSGATSATLYVYGRADACGGSFANSQQLLVNNVVILTFNPCNYFHTDRFEFMPFSVDLALLVDGATNSFRIREWDGETDRNLHLGIDLSRDYGRSDIVQGDCCTSHSIAGELMWYLSVGGPVGTPGASVSPSSVDFGSVYVGSSSTERTVTVTSTGTANLRFLSVWIDGLHSSDFVKTSDTCEFAHVPPGSSCTVRLRFQPQSIGTRTATLRLNHDANTGQTVPLSGWGYTDTTPPTSTFTTANGDVVLSGGDVLGRSVDDITGIAYVQLTFTPVVAALAPSTVTATLTGCTGTACDWKAPAPLVPGVYLVNARATDYAFNTETPGPTLSIIVA